MIGLLQKKKIVNLPVSLKGNSKLICGKIVDMSPLEAQNKDIGAVWQTLLGGVLLTLHTQARRVEALPVSHARAYLRNRILTFSLNSI